VKPWDTYNVNGYRFHTEDHNDSIQTYNCGVCVRMDDTTKKKAKSASQILQRTSFCVAELLRRAYLQRPKALRCRFPVSATKKNLALQIFVDQYYLQRKKIIRC